MRVYRSPLLLILLLAGCTVSPAGISFNWQRPVAPQVVTPDVVEPEIVGREFRFLLIEDEPQRSKLPPAQLSMLTSKNVRDFCKANCVKDDKGNPQYRIIHHGTVEDLTGVWKEMASKYPAQSYPWLILTNGSAGTGEPLPRDWETLQSLLHKYAGVK